MKKVVVFLLLSLVLSSCQLGRFVFWNFADADDYKKFKNYTVEKSEDPYHYAAYPGTTMAKILAEDTEAAQLEFDEMIRRTKTQAILIIRNDTIIYQKYYGKNNPETLVTSFSIAKSFISALIGIAIDEGYIKSTDDFMVDYLPWMKDKGMDSIRIQHLLDMKSGIRFREGYFNPSSEVAKLYYGRNLKKTVGKFKKEDEAGGDFKYSSGDTQLLGFILESATGKRLPEYMQEKIWQPMGAEANALWSMDSKKHGMTKAFCGINAQAIDFAKFGSIYLHGGHWNGKQIVPQYWVDEVLKFEPEKEYRFNYYGRYHNQWWAYDKSVIAETEGPNGNTVRYARFVPDDMRIAEGILGQFILIWPSQNIVVLRFGEKDKDIQWPWVLRKLAEKNALNTTE